MIAVYIGKECNDLLGSSYQRCRIFGDRGTGSRNIFDTLLCTVLYAILRYVRGISFTATNHSTEYSMETRAQEAARHKTIQCQWCAAHIDKEDRRDDLFVDDKARCIHCYDQHGE